MVDVAWHCSQVSSAIDALIILRGQKPIYIGVRVTSLCTLLPRPVVPTGRSRYFAPVVRCETAPIFFATLLTYQFLATVASQLLQPIDAILWVGSITIALCLGVFRP